ncbi:MAG: hypothetical protein QOH06_2694 [Acidobacteriota bacterium]|jgi:hypothetical protein|nr:hypothetical protein [Acidobacteriota bacterium]
MRAIFISYRRDDAEGQAGRLFDDLTHHFGNDSVFMDVAAIEPGRDFRRAIDQHVASCGVLLAIIGKSWVTAKNKSGARRLDDPMDFVRLETASALKRDIPVVPVLVHGAEMPRVEDLPDDLKELAFRNGVELTHARWDSDVQVLIKALQPHVTIKEEPNGSTTRLGGIASRSIIGGLVSALILASGWYVWEQTSSKAAEGRVVPNNGPDLPVMPLEEPSEDKTPNDVGPKVPASQAMEKGDAGTTGRVEPKDPTSEALEKGDREPDIEVRQSVEPSPKFASLIGSWSGAPGCEVIIWKDDGKDLEGSCGTGVRHQITGRYNTANRINITITRIDPNNCVTKVAGTIKIETSNNIEMSQEGWHGCGVTTEPATTSLRRP